MMRHQEIGYDGDLQMFVERPREPDLARLQSLRWVSERGLLEQAALGAPTGEYAAVTRIERPPAA